MRSRIQVVAGMLAALAASALLPLSASADVVGSTADVDFTGSSTTFGYLGQSFTLSDNGSGFPNTVSASTSGTAKLATDFFGISVFFDPPRDYLFFDGTYNYQSYPSATTLSYSSLPTIIGLALTAADGVHYGYAEFAGTSLESYAFESAPDVGILADAPIARGLPEPASVALAGLGVIVAVGARRRRRV